MNNTPPFWPLSSRFDRSPPGCVSTGTFQAKQARGPTPKKPAPSAAETQGRRFDEAARRRERKAPTELTVKLGAANSHPRRLNDVEQGS